MDKALQKAKDAHGRRELFLEVHTKSRLLEIRLLYEIYHNEDYLNLGFEDFKDYCEAPIASGGLDISRSWATQMAKAYEVVKALNLSDQTLLEIGPRKLYAIQKRLNGTEEDMEWIEKAKSTSLKDLTLEVNDVPFDCDHDWEMFRKCKRCLRWEPIPPSQS